MTNPTTADRHLLVIADHIRSSASGRGQLAESLGGRRPDQAAAGHPTELETHPQGDRPTSIDPGTTPAAFEEFVAAISSTASGPFEDFIAAISRPAGDVRLHSGVQPPPSRFMVRAAAVAPPTRPTKRNYNYFEELDAALAERRLAEAHRTGSDLSSS